MCTAGWFVNGPQGRMKVMEDGHGDSSRYAFPRFVMVLLDRAVWFKVLLPASELSRSDIGAATRIQSSKNYNEIIA